MSSISSERAWGESAVISGTVAAFLALFAAAARSYPGGTHFDHASLGHDFWRNSLCDVARTVALNGAPNASGCTLARLAMTTLALGLGAFFFTVARLFSASRQRLARAVRVLGAATVPFAIAVVLLPTDRFGQLHGAAIVVAGTLGLSAVSLSLLGLAQARAPGLGLVRVLGVSALAVGALDFAFYLAEFLSGGAAQVAVPVLERVATFLLLGWMIAVVRARWQSQRGERAIDGRSAI